MRSPPLCEVRHQDEADMALRACRRLLCPAVRRQTTSSKTVIIPGMTQTLSVLRILASASTIPQNFDMPEWRVLGDAARDRTAGMGRSEKAAQPDVFFVIAGIPDATTVDVARSAAELAAKGA